MNKYLVVAKSEYISAVNSKAFIVGVIMMPVFMGGAFAVQYFAKDQVDLTERRLAVVDETGAVFPLLEAMAKIRNDNLADPSDEEADGDGDEGEEQADEAHVGPKFLVEKFEPEGDERPDVVLSERVESGDIFAFLIIRGSFDGEEPPTVSYHSNTPSYGELPDWVSGVVNADMQRRKMQDIGISPDDLAQLMTRLPVRRYGLTAVEQDGDVIEAQEESRAITIGVPMAGMMLLFMMVMTVAPTMLNNVLEEKMQKISEFLVSSVSPFELMLGKLVGTIWVAMTLSVMYLGAAYFIADYFEISDRISWTMYLWFAVFLVVALVIFGSIFSAVGAACNELRDAQSMMTPVMLLVLIPMFCLGPVIESPSSSFARILSLIPPATPMIMFLRVAIPPGPEVWELAVGVVLSTAFAGACVWAAGKIFRIGILAQGQKASLGQVAQWLMSKE